jgi:hypothetical protein
MLRKCHGGLERTIRIALINRHLEPIFCFSQIGTAADSKKGSNTCSNLSQCEIALGGKLEVFHCFSGISCNTPAF